MKTPFALLFSLVVFCAPALATSEAEKKCAAIAAGLTIGDASTFRKAKKADRKRLGIRPDLTRVRVSTDPLSHLQAVGLDSAGRQQYVYHPLWDEIRDRVKFIRMIDFGKALPRVRTVVSGDLRREDLDRSKVLAAVVRLLDRTSIRVGSEEYADENESYGLTTMLEEHVKVRGARVTFSFKGKSGVYHEKVLEDAQVAEVIRGLRRVGDDELFEYFGDDGAVHDVKAADVNEYLRAAAGGEFSAKDFRTWAGTVSAVEFLSGAGVPDSERGLKQLFTDAATFVSQRLGNTPSVARKSYIDPRVFEYFKANSGFQQVLARARRGRPAELSAFEMATLIALTE